MTFKELANYILTLPEDIQDSEATFANLDEDECVALSGENNKIAMIKDKTFAPINDVWMRNSIPGNSVKR